MDLRRLTFSSGAGVTLVAVACLMLLLRLPGVYSDFHTAAKAASGRNELGGALATADSLGLNDDFVRAAFAGVPKNGRFAIVLPGDEAAVVKAANVNPITFDGIGPFFGNYLLPRLMVKTVTRGTYILCFYCDASWNGRTHWLGPAQGGGRVGYEYR